MTPLDAALRSAMNSLWQDRAEVLAFYEQLLDTNLFVPAKPKIGGGTTLRRLPASDSITFWVYRRNGDLVMPVFDTADRLLEWTDSGAEILRFRGSDLVQNYCRDMLIAVNPYERYSRMLAAPEVQALRCLARERGGTNAAFRRSAQTGVSKVAYTADVTLGGNFLSAARSQLSMHPDVKAAYLVKLLDGRDTDGYQLLLMLDLETGAPGAETGISWTFEGMALGSLPKGISLKTAVFDPNSGLGASISNDHVAPFYMRDHAGPPDSRNLP